VELVAELQAALDDLAVGQLDVALLDADEEALAR
jgi:hypothetical protein